MDELRLRFGTFQGSARRTQLFKRLAELVTELRRSGLFSAVVIDGSFATAVAAPEDMDLIVGLRRDHDWSADLGMREYTLVSRSALRRRFGFDLFLATDGGKDYERYVEFFGRVREDYISPKRHVANRVMSKKTERLAQSIEMLELMNDALRHLRTEVLPKNARMFALMAEGPLEEMRRLQAEIEQLTAELVAAPTTA